MSRSPKCPPACDGCEVVRTCLDAGVKIPERVQQESILRGFVPMLRGFKPEREMAYGKTRKKQKTAVELNQEMGGLYPGGPSARDRYRKDASFKALVDIMEAHIHQCRFTPSELREAAVLAAIRYEAKRVPSYCIGVGADGEPNGELYRSPLDPLVVRYREKFSDTLFWGVKIQQMTRDELMAVICHVGRSDRDKYSRADLFGGAP